MLFNVSKLKFMTNTPEISIIVPIYKIERYLHQCIDSILMQTFTDFELLLIDDGSPDGCPAICDEYAKKDARVRVFHKLNGGLTSARNCGLDNSNGNWIMHIDGDDWVEPTYIEELYSAAIKNKADIAICGFRFAYEDGRCIEEHPILWDDNKPASMNRYIASVWAIACASIHKSKLYTDNGVRSPKNITFCEDFHLMARLCFFADKVTSIDRPLYNYRQQPSSIVHSTTLEKRRKDELTTYKEISEFFYDHGVIELYKKTISWRTINALWDMILDPSHFEEFKKYNPDKKNYIWSCPYIGFKLKVLAWLITHNCELIARMITRLRKLLGR